MTRPRLFVAAVALVTLGLLIGHPTLARSIGADVWNVPALNEQLRQSEDAREDLDAEDTEIRRRIAVKEALVAELIDGHVSLADVTARFLAINATRPHYMAAIRQSFPGATDQEKTARNVISYALARAPAGTADALAGTEIRVHGGVVISAQDAASSVGTVVDVADLFYNLPARRKFLKADGAETAQVLLESKDWKAVTAAAANGKMCFAMGKPQKMEPPTLNHGNVVFYVTTRTADNVRNEPSLQVGYPFKESSKLQVDIDGKNVFVLAGRGTASHVVVNSPTNVPLRSTVMRSHTA